MQQVQVLLVDDEPSIRLLVERTLSEKGFDVTGVGSASEALQLVINNEFDLYLVDIRLPDTSGLEFIEQLKHLRQDVTVIILSGSTEREHTLRASQLGVHGFITKPFTPQELINTLLRVLGERHRLQERIRARILSPLFEVSQGLLQEIQLKDLLDQVVQIAKREISADTVSIMLVEKGGDELTIAASSGLSEEVVQRTRKRMGEPLAGMVAERGEPLILMRGEPVDPSLHASLTNDAIAHSLCLPMTYKQKVVGVMNVNRHNGKGAFHQSDIELLSVLGRQAAVAVENVRLFDELQYKTKELRVAHFDTIKALAEALETKDISTRHHSDRTVEYALAVARALGLPDQEQEYIRYAAILHDIGKIGIPEDVLNKPARLTTEEYEVMKTHPVKGAQILQQIKFLQPVVPMVLHDHERFDGTGYPDGLSGEEIPIGSRIVAVVDAYDAMTSDRIYRKAPGHAHAVEELRRRAGTQFDPRIVETFVDLLPSLSKSFH
jgi:putative nucleotidyltransferase with HDIG domain